MRKIERIPCVSPSRHANRRFGRDRELAAAKRARRTGGVRVLGRIESVATAPARGLSRSFLDDRSRSGDLRLIAGLGRGLPIGRIWLHDGDIGLLGNGWRSAGSTLGAALKQFQALFELPVTILQFLVLAGELPQLILKLLNPDFRINVVGLGERRQTQDRRTQHQHRGDSRGARNLMKSE